MTLEQRGSSLSGTIFIFNVPSGTVSGTVDGRTVSFKFDMDGKNQGVLRPEDAPCAVHGVVEGTTDFHCYISAKLSGTFACPYACTAPDHIFVLSLGRGCR
jgi:hypothetical protein